MVYLVITEKQFKNFIKSSSKIELKKGNPKHSVSFPLDFELVYKNRYMLNFEYLKPALEFNIIGENLPLEKENKILNEIKKKIQSIIK